MDWGLEISLQGNGLSGFCVPLSPSHGLELVDALLGVSRSDLTQGLVLVPTSFHIFCMQHVVLRLLGVVPCLGQL